MRKLISALLLTLVTTNASALNTQTKDLLATIAMPLAVAAVSRVTGVPQTQLSNLVSTLNQANVPPAQFVDVMRYTPVALTDNNGQPIVEYVRTQASQGLTGDALVSALLQQLQTRYNVKRQPVLQTFVVDDSYVTPFDTGHFDNNKQYAVPNDSLISLPLAVAEVAGMNGVPLDQLAGFITTLNNANMPPAQMIEVVRYVPVALVDDPQPFVQYVQQQTSQGVTGTALYPLIVRRLQPYYPSTTISVVAPPPQPAFIARPVAAPLRTAPVVVNQPFVPQVVVRRTEEVRQHPHGGPPGQLKKQYGLQTGAEVGHAQPTVIAAPRSEAKDHGYGRGKERDQVVIAQPASPQVAPMAVPQVIVAAPAAARGRGNGRGPEGNGPPGQNKGDKGNGKDKEHGKDKGKD